MSVDANGNWASGTVLWNQDKSYAVVKCYVYKVVGSKRELCKGTVLYYTAEGSRVSRSIFNNGVFYVYIGKSANVIDVCVYAFNMASGKPVGDPLAMTSITINHDGAMVRMVLLLPANIPVTKYHGKKILVTDASICV